MTTNPTPIPEPTSPTAVVVAKLVASTELPDFTTAPAWLDVHGAIWEWLGIATQADKFGPEWASGGSPWTPLRTDDEWDRRKEAAKLAGKALDRWLDQIIPATHSEDIIDEDGDGDFEVVEERLVTMGRMLTREQIDGQRWGLDVPASLTGQPVAGQMPRTADEWVQRIDRDKLAEMLKPYFNGGDVAYGEHVECADAVLAALPDLMGGVA